jgi:hypothetical protein
MNGSGTTMLVDSLGHHPDLYGFPRETRVLPSLLEEHPNGLEPKTRADKVKLWDQVRGIPAFRGVNEGEPAPLPEGWEDLRPGVPEIFDAIIGQYVRASGKSRWIEKSPNHVQHMPRLATAFPEAKFIHIIRDGRACAASFWRRWGRTPELTIYRWKRLVETGRRDGEKLGDRYFELRYEDLTADPEKWMRDLCAFLGVVYTPDVLASRQPQSEHSGETGRIAKSTPKWREQLSGRCVARLEEIGGVMLETLGYPVDGVPGDAEIGRLRRAWWSSIDYSRQYWHEVQGKLSGESGRSWSIVWRLPMVALRQRRTNKY